MTNAYILWLRNSTFKFMPQIGWPLRMYRIHHSRRFEPTKMPVTRGRAKWRMHILWQETLVKMRRKLPIWNDFQITLLSEKTETKYTRVFIVVCYPRWQFYWLGILIILDIRGGCNVLFLYSQKRSKGNMAESQELTKLYRWVTQWFIILITLYIFLQSKNIS